MPGGKIKESLTFSPTFVDGVEDILRNYLFKNLMESGGWQIRPYQQGVQFKLGRVWEMNSFPKCFSRFILAFWFRLIEVYYSDPTDSIHDQPITCGAADRILIFCFLKDFLLFRQSLLLKCLPRGYEEMGLCSLFLAPEFLGSLTPVKTLEPEEKLYSEALYEVVPESFRLWCKDLEFTSEQELIRTLKGLELKLNSLYGENMDSGGFRYLEHYLGIGQILLQERVFDRLLTDSQRKKQGSSPKGEETLNLDLQVYQVFGGYLGRVDKIRTKLQSYSYVDEEFELAQWGLRVFENRWSPIESVMKAKLVKYDDPVLYS